MLIHYGISGYLKEPMTTQLRIARSINTMYLHPLCVNCVQPIDQQKKDHVFYNEELQAIIEWINRNLWFRLDLMSYPTAYVKYRIASSMLEKAFLQHIIDKDEYILYTSNLRKNIAWVQEQILNETLPF